MPKVVHHGRWGGYISNVPLGVISSTPFWLILNFTGWGHCGATDGETAKNSLNEPLGYTTITFFGNIQDVPTDYIMGTLQSHDQEHSKCPDCFLGWENSGKNAGKILNELEVYQMGTSLVLCPFPCSVFAMYRLRTPPFVPSEGNLWETGKPGTF